MTTNGKIMAKYSDFLARKPYKTVEETAAAFKANMEKPYWLIYHAAHTPVFSKGWNEKRIVDVGVLAEMVVKHTLVFSLPMKSYIELGHDKKLVKIVERDGYRGSYLEHDYLDWYCQGFNAVFFEEAEARAYFADLRKIYKEDEEWQELVDETRAEIDDEARLGCYVPSDNDPMPWEQ